MSGLYKGISGLWGGNAGLSRGISGLWGGASGLVAGGGVPPTPPPPVTTLFDFTTGVLNPLITASGGTNGTRINAAGFIEAAVTPRFTYDPVTLVPLGVLIEPGLGNRQVKSNDFADGAVWSKTDATVTPAAITSPDGTMNGALVTEGSAGTAVVSSGISAPITSGTANTGSRYFKYGNAQWIMFSCCDSGATVGVNVWVDLLNGVKGAVQNIGSPSSVVTSVTPAGNGWYRVAATVNLGAGPGALRQRSFTANADFSLVRVPGGTYYQFGAQVEQVTGLTPSSYIPNGNALGGGAVTRVADTLTVSGANFSFFNPVEGTIAVETQRTWFIGSDNFEISDGTANNVLQSEEINSNKMNFAVNAAGSPIAIMLSPLIIPGGTAGRHACVYKAGDYAGSSNGGVPVANTPAGLPSGLNQLAFGYGPKGQSYLGGTLRKLYYWNVRLPNAMLQAISTPGFTPVPPAAILTAAGTGGVLSGGGLTLASTTPGVAVSAGAVTSAKTTGKYYFETVGSYVEPSNDEGSLGVGRSTSSLNSYFATVVGSAARFGSGTVLANGGSVADSLPEQATGVVAGFCCDVGAGQVYCRVGAGAWEGPFTFTPGGVAIMPMISVTNNAGGNTTTARFSPASWTQGPIDPSYGPWTINP